MSEFSMTIAHRKRGRVETLKDCNQKPYNMVHFEEKIKKI